MAFSPDGSWVALGASGGDAGVAGQTLIFSYPGMEKILALDYPTDTCFMWMVFTADGRLLLSAGAGGNNDVFLWDTSTGDILQQFSTDKAMLNSIALSPDGHFAAGAGLDNIARMWEVATGREVRRFLGHEQPLNGIVFSPDGKWVATSSNDGMLKLWLVDLEALKADVCEALPRDFTDAERELYGIRDSEPTCP